jgi:hypothetical protein
MAYSKVLKRQIIESFNPNEKSVEEHAREHNISVRTLHGWLAGKINTPTIIKESEHVFPDFMKKLEKNVNVLDTLSKLVERVSEHKTEDKDYCKIAIKTGKPIAVMKAADLHLGGLDVDYKSLLDHYTFLLKEPNFYLQLFGDDLNLMVMHKMVGARHDALTPDEQCGLLVGMVNSLLEKGKLLSMCWGNHEEFTEKSAGINLTKLLLSNKVPYFRGMGYIDLAVGDQTYPMAFTHKTRFNSFMNNLHGCKRLQQCHAEYFGSNRPIAKEYITAHTHNPAVSYEGCLPEERIYYTKCGTFKTDDLYSQRFFGQGKIGVPTCVYFPDRFEHLYFPTPYEAYRYLNGSDWPGLKISEKK